MRLSIIGAAATAHSAVNIGADVCGTTLGSEQYILLYLSGAGWRPFTGVAAPSLEALRNKASGGDMKWLVVLSGACSLGIFGYLSAGEILKGMVA